MAKLKPAIRAYHPDAMPDEYVPAWRIVNIDIHYSSGYKTLAVFVYPTLEQANNGRILARAFSNFSELCFVKKEKVSWAAFARHLNYIHTPKHGRRRESLGDAVSAKIYGHFSRGTLPKDQRVLQ